MNCKGENIFFPSSLEGGVISSNLKGEECNLPKNNFIPDLWYYVTHSLLSGYLHSYHFGQSLSSVSQALFHCQIQKVFVEANLLSRAN